MWNQFLIILSIFALSWTVFGCDNYDINISPIRNCNIDGKNQVIKLCENSSIEINENCEIISNTCAEVKTYNHAFANAIVRNSFLVLMNISKEFCDKNKKLTDATKIGMAAAGINCDGGKEKHIIDHQRKLLKLSQSARKVFGLVNGEQIHVQISINHDTGKSCVEAEVKFKQHKLS